MVSSGLLAAALVCALTSLETGQAQTLQIELPPYVVYPPPAPSPLPPAGGAFVDPTFGATILRVTDSQDGAENYNAYSYWPTFNKDSTRLYVFSVGGQAKLYDFNPATMGLSNKRPAFPTRTPTGADPNGEDATWSWLNPNKMLAHDQDLRLWELDVATGVYTLIKDLRPFFPAGHHSAQTHWAYSNDDVVCFSWKDAEYNTLGAGVYKRSTDRFWRFDLVGMDECTMDKTGRYLEMDTGLQGGGVIEDKFVDLETGLVTDIEDGGPSDPNQPGPYWAPGHGDNGAGLRVAYDNWNNRMLSRRHADPGQFTSLLSFGRDWWVGNHSSLLSDDESWITISTYDTDPQATNLWKNQILQLATDGSQRIRRLLHHHSNWGGQYWHTPRAAISKDGQFVTFTSNWGDPLRTDVFVARVGSTSVPSSEFSLSTSPSTQTISPGGSAVYNITVSPQAGFTGVVTLSAGGLPAGAAAVFSPPSVTVGGSSLMTVSTSAGTPLGDPHTITVTGTSGSKIHSANLALRVVTPDFTLSASPVSRLVLQGASTTYWIEVGQIGTFTGVVTFSVSGLPSGVTGSFSPASVTGPGTSVLTINTTGSTPVGGPYPLTVTGTSGALVHTDLVALSVTPATDFLLSAAPGSQSTVQGGSADYTVTVAASGGFSGTVSFAVTGLPTGSSATFTPSTVTGSGSTVMRVTTTGSTPVGGPYTLTVTGTSGALSHTASVALSVTGAADFALSATPSSQSTVQGGSADYTVTVTPSGGFSGVVSFGVTGLPTGSSVTFTPATVTGSGSTLMKVTTTGSTPVGGPYTLTVTGTSGALSHTASVALSVTGAADFALSATPSSQSTVQGGSADYTVTVTPSGGFSGVVSFGVTGLPAGSSVTFTPSTVTGSGSTVMKVTTTGSTPVGGPYTLTVTGTSGALSHTASVALSVTGAADFALSATPSSQSTVQGGSADYTVTVTPSGGFGGTVSFTVAGLPAGSSVTFTPATVTGSGSTVMKVTTTGSTPVGGPYTLTVTGTSGALSHTASVTLSVTAPPDFALSSVPTSQSTPQGGSADYTVTVTPSGGFSGTVSFLATGLPAGSSATFTPSTVTGSGSTVMKVTTTGSTPVGGPYTLTVTGASGALSRTASVTLSVTAPPDFALSGTPPSQSTPQGGSADYTVTVTPSGGFSGTVSFLATGLSAGSSATFTPSTVTGSGSTVMRVTTTGSTPVGGPYTLTVTGASGALTRTTAVALTVTAVAPDFSISATPASRSVGRKGTTTYTVTVVPNITFNGTVTFSASGLPNRAKASFTPSSVVRSGSTTFQVGSSGGPKPSGAYTLTITATSGALTRTTTVTFIVS